MQMWEMEQAEERLRRGRQLVKQQRARVAQLDGHVNGSRQSKLLLREMERALIAFQDHVALLQREVAEEKAAKSVLSDEAASS